MSKPVILQKRVCIIGAGPAGLAALKTALDSPGYQNGAWSASAFEAREGLGGIWLQAPPTDDPPLTPLYDSMTTNIPHPVMAYTSYPFPPSTPLFPPAATVLTYLRAYAAHFDLLPHIHFNSTVESVDWDSGLSHWTVVVSNLGHNRTLHFDNVIIANGHFRVPRYPDIPGLDRWLASGKASHAAWYRNPASIGSPDTLLVVGAGPSGLDISAEMCAHAKLVVHAVSGATTGRIFENLKSKGRVVRMEDDRRVTFEDGSELEKVDHCVLATGYQYSIPFLSPNVLASRGKSVAPSSSLPDNLQNSGYHVFPLARHIFPLDAPFPSSSLAFMGLLLRGTPLSLFEAQALFIAQVLRDPASLDVEAETKDIVTRYQQLRAQFGDDEIAIAKDWHRYTEPESFVYRDNLHRAARLERRVEEWEKEMWAWKVELRSGWNELVRSGDASGWIEDVGHRGQSECVQLMRRILDRNGER